MELIIDNVSDKIIIKSTSVNDSNTNCGKCVSEEKGFLRPSTWNFFLDVLATTVAVILSIKFVPSAVNDPSNIYTGNGYHSCGSNIWEEILWAQPWPDS